MPGSRASTINFPQNRATSFGQLRYKSAARSFTSYTKFSRKAQKLRPPKLIGQDKNHAKRSFPHRLRFHSRKDYVQHLSQRCSGRGLKKNATE